MLPPKMYFKIYLIFGCVIISKTEDIPNCDYYDTVSLTESDKTPNGFYIYEGVRIPVNLTGSYDYELEPDGERVSVEEHTRGCICKLRPCVHFCCHPKDLIDDESGVCMRELNDDLQYDPYVNITYDNGGILDTHILNNYVVQEGLPCMYPYPLHADTNEVDEWKLFKNGTLLRVYDQKYLAKSAYCFQPVINDDGVYVLKPHNCPTLAEPTIAHTLNVYVMCVSISFLLLTILVYLIEPQLRNLQGKCLVCYFFALAVGYTMLATIYQVPDIMDISCRLIGYIGYFAFMSAFLWLTVISFDLSHTFWATNYIGRHLKPGNSFVIYCFYVFSGAIILTMLVYLAEQTEIDENWRPGIGVYTCWVNTEFGLAALVYFYGPMLLFVLFNLIMFILCAIRIAQINTDLKHVEAREERVQCLKYDQQNFWLYARLFLIMGLAWLLEICSYLSSGSDLMTRIFMLPDLFNAAQGIIIFVLCVLRPKVRRLLKRRLLGNYAQNDTEQYNEEISLQEQTLQQSY